MTLGTLSTFIFDPKLTRRSGSLGEIEDIPTVHQKWEGRFESFKAAHGKENAPEEHNVRINNYRNNYRSVGGTFGSHKHSQAQSDPVHQPQAADVQGWREQVRRLLCKNVTTSGWTNC